MLIINGPLGVGKTTIAWYLLEKIHVGVMLDGDYIAALHPFDHHNPTHLDYAYHTFRVLIAHHLAHGIHDFVLNWVFEDPARLQQFRQALADLVTPVLVYRLTCAPEELAVRIHQVIQEAGWEHIPFGTILGDDAPWIWNVADAHCPGVRQPLDYDHLSAHLHRFANLQFPNNPAEAKAWVEQNMGALLMDHVGEVLRAPKRMRPWHTTVCDALDQLIGDVERNRTRSGTRSHGRVAWLWARAQWKEPASMSFTVDSSGRICAGSRQADLPA